MENLAGYVREEQLARQIDLEAYLVEFLADLEDECARQQVNPEFIQREMPPTREQLRYNKWLLGELTKPGDTWHEWINNDLQSKGIALVRQGSIVWATTANQLIMRRNF